MARRSRAEAGGARKARARGTRAKREVAEAEHPQPTRDAHVAAMAAIAGEMEGVRPAEKVLTRVVAVPTIFPYYDWTTRVGGQPTNRITLVHGPSSNGKSVFANGLGYSFLRRGHFFLNVDAERTNPITWFEDLMGAEYARHPAFLALRPTTYEQTVDAVESFCTRIGAAKAAGRIRKETSGLIVVDSLRKLVPDGIMRSMLKHAAESEKGSVDGMNGRAAQIKAALNSAWMDRLVPLLDDTGCAMVIITREIEDTTADANDRKYGRDYKLTGGKAVYFDSSLVVRIVRDRYVCDGPRDKPRMLGERHRVEIHKTKVAGREEKVVKSYFHTSNGVLIPPGFDKARDLIDLGRRLGVVGTAGSWMSWNRKRWNGEDAGVKMLTANPDALGALEDDVRSRFDLVVPPEESADDAASILAGMEVSANG